MSTTQDKQDLTVTVTTPEQDAPLSSAAPQTVAAGEDLPEAAADAEKPASEKGGGWLKNAGLVALGAFLAAVIGMVVQRRLLLSR